MTAEKPDVVHNVRLLVAYDGSGFRGLAENRGVRTVVGELRPVIADLCGGSAPELVMSGRTDAGVHATGQVLSFALNEERWSELERRGGLARLQKSINARLGPEVVARSAELAEPEFSARFSATGRRYHYWVLNAPVPDPLLANRAWHVAPALSVDAMSSAAAHFVGELDFSSFCRAPKVGEGEPPASLTRRVTGARWSDVSEAWQSSLDADSRLLRFEIEGSAFCHQMVRSIVGFLVEVGRGRRRPDEVAAVLAARDRNSAAQPAPPHGLVLYQVDY